MSGPWLFLGLIALLSAGGILVGRWWLTPDSTPAPPDDPFPLPPITASPYLNTGADARYVGSDRCRGCHEGRHDSFRSTGMGRSMAAVDPAREPPDRTYDHPPSRRRYQVVRRDGQVWHRELLLTNMTPEVLLSEYPLKYVVGSGRHSLTYVVEADGFLVESPATWYSAKKDWDMSPGYKTADQPGFERAVGEGCLVCHAGRVEVLDGSHHRVRVIEEAIGCERCHGPGSLHVERHRGRTMTAPRDSRETDLTIVNPARLSRELAESVCQQCHLRPTAVVPARGRNVTDFRPGLPIQDFLHAYQFEAADGGMTVVGHVEQMHLSRCYKGSDSLTCLTCHSPHNEPRPENSVEHYRAACMTCHKQEQCKVEPARRAKESPANDCVQCHMPRSPTEIPHLAFTHHRIGIHDRPAGKSGRGGELLPFLDLSRLGEIDRRRSLGLGYLEAASREHDRDRSLLYRNRAADLLTGVRAEGLRDPAVDANLARLHFELGWDGVMSLTDAALEHPGLVGNDRCNVLLLRADALVSQGRHAEALAVLRELVKLRRQTSDWLLMAECQRATGDQDGWAESLVTAVRISPRHWQVHRTLADHFQRKGDAKRAEWHRVRAVPG